MNKEEFYQKCSEILDIEHKFKTIWKNERRSGRWGPREPGNGRFPGFGLIRWFGPNYIHMTGKGINKSFTSPENALEYLSKLLGPAPDGTAPELHSGIDSVRFREDPPNFFEIFHAEADRLVGELRVEELRNDPAYQDFMRRRMTGE